MGCVLCVLSKRSNTIAPLCSAQLSFLVGHAGYERHAPLTDTYTHTRSLHIYSTLTPRGSRAPLPRPHWLLCWTWHTALGASLRTAAQAQEVATQPAHLDLAPLLIQRKVVSILVFGRAEMGRRAGGKAAAVVDGLAAGLMKEGGWIPMW